MAGDLVIGNILQRTKVDGDAFPHRLPCLGDDVLPIKPLPIRWTAILTQPDAAGLESLSSQCVLPLSVDPRNSVECVQRSIGAMPFASRKVGDNLVRIETNRAPTQAKNGQGSTASLLVRLYTQAEDTPNAAHNSATVSSFCGGNGLRLLVKSSIWDGTVLIPACLRGLRNIHERAKPSPTASIARE